MNHPSVSSMQVLGLLFCWGVATCTADSWSTPKTKTYTSDNGRFSFKVVPGMRLGYPPEISEKRKQGLDTGPSGPLSYIYAKGTLWRKDDDGTAKVVWERRLFNRWAPLDVLVANSGDFVVTVDEWGGNLHSTNWVVIYNQKGKLVRRFGLMDLLSESEQKKIAYRTATSYWWGRGHYIDEARKVLVLKVVANRKLPWDAGVEFKEKYLSLETGEFVKAVSDNRDGSASP